MMGEQVIWNRQSNWWCSYSFYQRELTVETDKLSICCLLVSRKCTSSQLAEYHCYRILYALLANSHHEVLPPPFGSAHLRQAIVPLHRLSFYRSTDASAEISWWSLARVTLVAQDAVSSRSFKPTHDLKAPSANLFLAKFKAPRPSNGFISPFPQIPGTTVSQGLTTCSLRSSLA